MRRLLVTLALLTLVAAALSLGASAVRAAPAEPGQLTITNAVILGSRGYPAGPERESVAMLKSEVQKRTGVRLTDAKGLQADRPVIVLASRQRLPRAAAALARGLRAVKGADGFAIKVIQRSGKSPVILALGNDPRGTLFAAGRLLRELRMRRGQITLPGDFHVATAPKYPMRGHQLGYRPKSNAYDAWDVKGYAQYIRDLAVFGTNDIELIPSFGMDDGQYTSPMMRVDPWEMTVGVSKVIAKYGLGVYFWIPYNNKRDGQQLDISKPEDVQYSLAERKRLFEAIPRLDGMVVPTGDPGNLPPEIVLPYLEKLAAVMKSVHPKAEMWSTHQGLSEEELVVFYRNLADTQPPWLAGIAYGPWAKDTLEHTRAAVPARYKVRAYPDITHSVRCQYPVSNWDDALAWTLNRECINPRPTQHAHICRLLAPYTSGFISYSDGVNDDVNKMIWSAIHWDPDADVRELLVQYGRYFIGPDFAEDVADGLLALEANFQPPLLTSQQVPRTLAMWQAMERRATPEVLANWRFQQGLFRAYYDAYIQQRLMRETQVEEQALAKLRQASGIGADAAMAAARQVLDATYDTPVAPELRARVEALAGDLYKSIGMQLSVEKYNASGAERGAVLTTMDTSLNNRPWIEGIFDEVADKDEQAKLAAIDTILHWEDPGPGGFYDDFGDPTREPHLVVGPGFAKDPGFVLSAKNAFGGPDATRLSWRHQAEGLYSTPLRARYEGLDPNAAYQVQVVYTGRYNSAMAMFAEGVQVHGPIEPTRPPLRHTFDIPREATADGVLELSWTQVAVNLAKGRGPQVAEVWIIKK